MCEHDNLIPENVSQRSGDQFGGPQQTLDLGLLDLPMIWGRYGKRGESNLHLEKDYA